MATRGSAAKQLKRSTQDLSKQAREAKEPQATAAALDRPQEKSHPKQKAPALDSAPSLAERLEAQREQLFKVMSIVECCKYASATLLDVDDSEYMVPAFDTIYDLLNMSAGELEAIASECDALD